MNSNDVVFNQTIGAWLTQNAWLLTLVIAWSIAWKGLALWRAAQKQDKVWYILLLVVNTVGILEILYLFYFSGKKLIDDSQKAKEHTDKID